VTGGEEEKEQQTHNMQTHPPAPPCKGGEYILFILP
jgi:hypothetical protein